MTSRGWMGVAVSVIVVVGVVYLFLPHINSDPVRREVATTAHAVQSLGSGLEAFKKQFGLYPPSSWSHPEAVPNRPGFTGSQLMVFYLVGPDGKGWGAATDGAGPFGGSVTGTQGPFFWPDCGDPKGGDAALDAFKPARPILYFRAEPGREPLFDVRDNPGDDTGRTGFSSQEHFEMLVRPKKKFWVREDYLLISPGPDGIYGCVIKDKATGQLRLARLEENNEAWCDDIANFCH
jgi:hypothetical protein